jgi:hypothetical protein
MRIIFIAVLLLTSAMAAQAQYPLPDQRLSDREQSVLNEDGGLSFTVLPTAGSLVGVLKPGESGSLSLQQYSVFVGPGWGDPNLHESEKRLSKLLTTVHDHAQLNDLSQAGLSNIYEPTWTIERLDIAGNRKIGDLEIQSIIRDVVNNGAQPNGDAIFVVYLDPSLQSTLGPLQAGKHYMSYHGYANACEMRIHYAVVPYQSDPQAAYQTALRTLVVAALHSASEDPQ